MIHLRVLLETLVLRLQQEEANLFRAAQNPKISVQQSMLLEAKSRDRGELAIELTEILERDYWAQRVAEDRAAKEADTQS